MRKHQTIDLYINEYRYKFTFSTYFLLNGKILRFEIHGNRLLFSFNIKTPFELNLVHIKKG